MEPIPTPSQSKSTLRTSILIFGGFCIAYNLGTALHELGHAIATWLTGGTVYSISLNPFAWSWTSLDGGEDSSPLFIAWGGVLFGVLFSALAAGIATLYRRPWLSPLYLLGGCALASNGIYLAVAAFADVGDAGNLIQLGVPRFCVVGLGGLLLLLSCLWMSLIQPRIGIAPATSFRQRLFTLHLGVTPYLIAMLVYARLFNPEEIWMWVGYTGLGFVAVTATATFGHLLRNGNTKHLPLKTVQSTWPSSILIFLIGMGIVIGELLYFGT